MLPQQAKCACKVIGQIFVIRYISMHSISSELCKHTCSYIHMPMIFLAKLSLMSAQNNAATPKNKVDL